MSTKKNETALQLVFSLLLAALLYSSTANATVTVRGIETGKIVDFKDGLDWANTSSDVSIDIEFCVTSTDAAGNSSNYAISVGTINPYSLSSGIPPDLPVIVQFAEIVGGTYTGFETLTPNIFTAQNKTGGTSRCRKQDPDNAVLRLTLLNADLKSARAGNFQRDLTITARGGTGTETKSSTIKVRMIIKSLIKLTGITDISFPVWDKINPLIASQSVCVYRNGGGGYSVNAQGSGSGFAFTLANGAFELPYSVSWSDSSSTKTLAAKMTEGSMINSFTANPSCDGGASNNATFTVTITTTSLAAATQGVYTGTLTFIVAPQ